MRIEIGESNIFDNLFDELLVFEFPVERHGQDADLCLKAIDNSIVDERFRGVAGQSVNSVSCGSLLGGIPVDIAGGGQMLCGWIDVVVFVDSHRHTVAQHGVNLNEIYCYGAVCAEACLQPCLGHLILNEQDDLGIDLSSYCSKRMDI